MEAAAAKTAPEWVQIPQTKSHRDGYDATYPDNKGHVWQIHTRQDRNGRWRGIWSYDGTPEGARFFCAGNPLVTKAQLSFDNHEDAVKAITDHLDS